MDTSLPTDDLLIGTDESANQFDLLFAAALNQQMGSVNGINASNQVLNSEAGLSLVGTDTIINQNDVISSLKMNISNEHIKTLIDNNQVTIPNGKYTVESIDVTDSKVTFELLAAQTVTAEQSEPVKIQVPLDALKIDKQVLNQLQNRVEVNPVLTKVDGQQIQELFEKLNLKQIEIKGLDTDGSKGQLKEVSLALIGEDNGKKVVLQNSIKRNQVKVSSDTKNVPMKSVSTPFVAQKTDGEVVVSDDTDGETKPNMTVQNGKESLIESESGKVSPDGKKSSLVEKVKIENQIFKTDTNISSVNTDSKSIEHQTGESKPVRMQLPESIKTVLRPNGQAVTIKIDPENLGPAKLSLKFTDNKLTAHLTVNSAHAKNLLDHSIERLVDQLHKVDINVDKINITLDNEQQEQNQFARNAAWQRKFSYKNLQNNEDYNIENNQMITPQMMTNNQYVSSSGVNLLA
ncbi:MAG: flagellar hook-length control protein FliK [Calditrichaeota bacterium]|nr:MAG: flagellar hook-length control protein FliK [Calditrichota bacterium]